MVEIIKTCRNKAFYQNLYRMSDNDLYKTIRAKYSIQSNMNYYFILLLTIWCVAVVAKRRVPKANLEQWEEVAAKFKGKCILESNADLNVVDRMVYELEFPHDLALYRFWTCVHEELRAVNNNNNMLNGESISKRLPFITAEISSKCTSEENKIRDLDTKAFEDAKCVINNLAVEEDKK